MGQIFDRPAPPEKFLEALPSGLWSDENGGSSVLAEFEEKYPELQTLGAKLREVRDYGKASEAHAAAIRDAMSYPNDESKLVNALKDLNPSVDVIAGWYDAGENLAALVPRLAADVERDLGDKAPGQSTSIKAMMCVLSFMLEFDSAKMSTPSIQNDFSFVRRAQNKNASLTSNILDPNKASVCSMFIAQSSPMIARVAAEIDVPTAVKIAKVASVCAVACSDKRIDPGQRETALAATTAAFVLYDRAAKNPGGAFAASSPVNAKRVATAIKKYAADTPDRLNVLFGAFMYSTVNYSKAASTAVQNIVDR
mmetsp:Transcript_9858/g.32111  ORF Transcript_9858/g.32111 Transcript_9858/m.32111 type:complete len:310 (-) Transcript_9858:131-1060(-)